MLNTYAVLASSGITAASALNVTSGSFGSSTPTYTGAITGHENSGADVTAAQASLVNLVAAINSLPADALSLPVAVGDTITVSFDGLQRGEVPARSQKTGCYSAMQVQRTLQSP